MVNKSGIAKANIKPPANSVRKYRALRIRQRPKAPELIVFCVPAKDVLVWAHVNELGPNKLGPQRARRQAKVNAIEKYFQSDPHNAIPTSVLVAFKSERATFTPRKDDGASDLYSGGEYGVLEVDSGDDQSAEIVDGQHRVYGMASVDPNMAMTIVGILAASDVENAFQFLVVNNKATRVPATHAKALLAQLSETPLVTRLKGAGISLDAEGLRDVDVLNTDPDSVFFHTIDWPTTPLSKRMVQATAIEASLDWLERLGVPDFDDRDVRRSVFSTIWTAARVRWPELWTKDSRLISKVGVICLTRYVAELIVSWADNEELKIDLADLDTIREESTKIMMRLDSRFWTAPWATTAQGGFDTNQGRDRVFGAIRQLYRNSRFDVPWYTDIDILDSTAAKEMSSSESPTMDGNRSTRKPPAGGVTANATLPGDKVAAKKAPKKKVL